MPATAPMFWTRGSVSLQRMSDLPGPSALRITPVTSTAKGSGWLPSKTVHTTPVWPAFKSSMPIAGASMGWSCDAETRGETLRRAAKTRLRARRTTIMVWRSKKNSNLYRLARVFSSTFHEENSSKKAEFYSRRIAEVITSLARAMPTPSCAVLRKQVS